MNKSIGIILMVTLFCLPTFAYEQSKTLTLPIEGLALFKMECGAGYLKIRGVEGLDRIEVTANIIIKGMSEKKIPAFIEKKVVLYLKKEGDRAILVSKIKNPKSFLFSLKKKRFAIDLEVKTPAHLKLDVRDGSGEISITGLEKDLILKDGSGSITLSNINGRVQIKDGSGNLRLQGVGGDTTIVDGSGSIWAKSLRGSLNIKDGSGSIEVKNIAKSVKIKDGSGSMDIFQVLGSVWISDGSGSIYLDNVEGDVTIAEAGSGGLKIRNVKGEVHKN